MSGVSSNSNDDKKFSFKETLFEKLVLSQSIHGKPDENGFLKSEWFCCINIGEWEEVEIFVEGSREGPDELTLEMAEEMMNQLSAHIKTALGYLKRFIPVQEASGYDLLSVTFGSILTIEGSMLRGFSLLFIYGDDLEAFQFKVKFKQNGWPIGFEGGPL